MPTVFWAWQSDLSARETRHFIKSALEAAIAEVNETVDPEFHIELDEATRDREGTVSIPQSIEEKIDQAALFVADLTPVHAANGRHYPNPNVLYEHGYAMGKLGQERLAPVMNLAFDAKHEDLPFDIRHRRITGFNCPAGVARDDLRRERRRLVSTFVKAIENACDADLKQASLNDLALTSVPTRLGDRSMWHMDDPVVEIPHPVGPPQRYTLSSDTHAYLRVIPHDWPEGLPTLQDIAGVDINQAPWVRSHSLPPDYGVFESGYLWLVGMSWEDAEDRAVDANSVSQSALNVSAWFEDTGEFWIVHGSAIYETPESRMMSREQILSEWASALAKSMALLDRFGASDLRRVEAGVTGVKGFSTRSPSPMHPAVKARKDATYFQDTRRAWDEDAQHDFLRRAFEQLLSLSGESRLSDPAWDRLKATNQL